jgi:ribosomal protein S18 acetylase RimI-like enzyme
MVAGGVSSAAGRVRASRRSFLSRGSLVCQTLVCSTLLCETTVVHWERRQTVRLLADAAVARVFLRRDLPLWAWPLCTLGSREWPYVRLWVDDAAEGDGADTPGDGADGPGGSGCPRAGLWVFEHPGWGGGVQAFGEVAALERMLRSVSLPGRAFVRILPPARDLLTARYRFDWLEPIVRMHVTPETLLVPAGASTVEPLGQADAAGLAALYAIWPESRFQTSRLRHGYRYVGIRDGSRIVAVAEQVLEARGDGLAVVQGVLVDPAWRGRGLAGAVTAALTVQLFEGGARDVVLDVRESNLPALAAYARIGYRRHVTLLAGPGVAR